LCLLLPVEYIITFIIVVCEVLVLAITFTINEIIQMYRLEGNALTRLEVAKALADSIRQMTSLMTLE